MNKLVSRCLPVGAAVALALPALAQGISWAPTLDGALADAKARNTVVMVALNMPGERASDEMVARHYKDSRLVELSRKTINLLFTVGPEGSPSADEALVRKRYLQTKPDDWIAVPHHLFIRPNDGHGEVVSSAAYRLTEGQLEWMWVDAIRRVQPEFVWDASARSRAPERLLYGSALAEGGQRPPTKEEVDEAVKELGKSRGAIRGMRGLEQAATILRSEERSAIQFVESTLRSSGDRLTGTVLETIGEVSPKVWWELTADYLSHRDAELREQAARALEKLAEPKSRRALEKQMRAEEESAVKGRLLRALAVVGPSEKVVVQTIEKELTKQKNAEVRVQAAAALVPLEDKVVLHRLCKAALDDAEPDVRAAAAFAVAARRDRELLPLVEARLQGEKDEGARRWLELSVEVVKGGDFREFRPFARDVLGDRDRERTGREGRRGRG